MKLHDYKKLAEEEQFKQILMTNFEECTGFQSLCTSHTDFLYQQPTFPFLLPTPCVVDRPLEFSWANNRHVASWSEAGD